jgi:hypothetical protein
MRTTANATRYAAENHSSAVPSARRSRAIVGSPTLTIVEFSRSVSAATMRTIAAAHRRGYDTAGSITSTATARPPGSGGYTEI